MSSSAYRYEASPYDLDYLGLKPIKIETEKGKKNIKQHKNIVFKSKKVRSRLIAELELLWIYFSWQMQL